MTSDELIKKAGTIEIDELDARIMRRFGVPASLAKACTDQPFQYAIGLKSGTVINFYGIVLSDSGWAKLDYPVIGDGVFERGIDVRISEIEWCADTAHA